MKIFCFRVCLVGEKSGRKEKRKRISKNFDIYSCLKEKMNNKIIVGT